MLEKIQAAASLMIIPTIALYLSGFICMTGYLARFGIITFDVVNARFLVAGLHALLPMALSIWFSWTIYKSNIGKGVFTFAGRFQRFIIYLDLILTPYFAAICFAAFYSAANFTKTSSPDVFNFDQLGWWDIAGLCMRVLDWGFGAKLAFYLCFYGLVIFVPIFILFHVALRRRKEGRNQASGVLLAQTGATIAPAPSSSIERAFLSEGITSRTIVFSVDVVAFGVLIATVIYSGWRVHSEVLDAASLSNLSFDRDLLLAWFYATNFSILIFLAAPSIGGAQLLFSDPWKWFTPENVADALYRFVTPVLASLFLFGATIFPRIPAALGGGMPREVVLTLKGGDRQFDAGTKFLLGESSQFLFVVQIDAHRRRAYQINKDVVDAVMTWGDVLPEAKSGAAHSRRRHSPIINAVSHRRGP